MCGKPEKRGFLPWPRRWSLQCDDIVAILYIVGTICLCCTKQMRPKQLEQFFYRLLSPASNCIQRLQKKASMLIGTYFFSLRCGSYCNMSLDWVIAGCVKVSQKVWTERKRTLDFISTHNKMATIQKCFIHVFYTFSKTHFTRVWFLQEPRY